MDNKKEIWRPVVGFEGRYEVSDLGRVRSLDRLVTKRIGKPFLRKGRVLFGNSSSPNGYRTVNLGGRNEYVHSLVLEAFTGPRPPRFEACHKNGSRTDNNLSNLRWDSARANQGDRVQHGTSNRGEHCAAAKLTESQAREIFSSTERGSDLAKKYGVAQQTICNIRKGRRWSHLFAVMCLVLAAATSCRAQAPQVAEVRHDITWCSLEEAIASDKIVYIHFTDAPYCNPCIWQERSFSNPRVISDSDEFACVIMCWCDETLHKQIKELGCRSFPEDRFIFRDRKRKPLVFRGWKESWGPEQMLQRFRQAIKEDRR